MAREIRFYEKYFTDFYLSLNSTVQEKIEYVFKVIRTVDIVPQKFLKHIESTEGLYEIRIKVGSDIYRVFAVLTKERLLYYSMDFRKRVKRPQKRKLTKH